MPVTNVGLATPARGWVSTMIKPAIDKKPHDSRQKSEENPLLPKYDNFCKDARLTAWNCSNSSCRSSIVVAMLSEYIILPPFLPPLRHPLTASPSLSHALRCSLPLALSLPLSNRSSFSTTRYLVYVVTQCGAQRATALDRDEFLTRCLSTDVKHSIFDTIRTVRSLGASTKAFRNSTVILPLSNTRHTRRDRSRS